MFSGNPRHGEYFPASIRRWVTGAMLVSLMLGTGLSSAKPGNERKVAPTVAAPEIAEKQADLGELRNRIEGLRKELSTNEENKADAGDRLRESERKISGLQRELHELNEQRGQLQRKLRNLEQQSQELAPPWGNNRHNWKNCSTSNTCAAHPIRCNSFSTATTPTRWRATCITCRPSP